MGVAEEKDCSSANWVTHNGCDKKNPIGDVQKVPQLRETMSLRVSACISMTLNWQKRGK